MPEARPVTQYQQHERQRTQAQPEEDREHRRGRVHLDVLQLGQPAALERRAPARRAELPPPVRLVDAAGLQVALAVGAMELEAHRRARLADSSCGGSRASSGGAPLSPLPPLPPFRSSPPFPSASWPGSFRKSNVLATPSSQSSISWVNDTSLENSAPTDSPRWIRLIASPISGATDSVVILAIRLAAGSGIESVTTTSMRFDSRIRSTAGSLRTPCEAQAEISVV